MSIGPSEQRKQETKIQQVRFATLNASAAIVKRPAASLFYMGTAVLLIALIIGAPVPGAYYAVLSVVGAIAAAQWWVTKGEKTYGK